MHFKKELVKTNNLEEICWFLSSKRSYEVWRLFWVHCKPMVILCNLFQFYNLIDVTSFKIVVLMLLFLNFVDITTLVLHQNIKFLEVIHEEIQNLVPVAYYWDCRPNQLCWYLLGWCEVIEDQPLYFQTFKIVVLFQFNMERNFWQPSIPHMYFT